MDDDRETDDYDSPWNGLIEGYFPDFLDWFFPQAHAGIDWARGYEFLDQELAQVTRDADPGLADAVAGGTGTAVVAGIEGGRGGEQRCNT